MELYDTLKQTVKHVLREDIYIDNSTNFNDLGLDSLKLTILTKRIIDLYQVDISRADIVKAPTIEGLSELIYQKTV